MAETKKYQTKSNLHCLLLFNFPSLSQWQIAFLGPLEWRNLFGPKDKVSSHEMLVFRSGVQFLFLFVLIDAILLKLDLQNKDNIEILFFNCLHFCPTFLHHTYIQTCFAIMFLFILTKMWTVFEGYQTHCWNFEVGKIVDILGQYLPEHPVEILLLK